MSYVCDRKRQLRFPLSCPPYLANQLSECWNYDPKERPGFQSLVKSIQDTFLESNKPGIVFDRPEFAKKFLMLKILQYKM